MAGAEYSIVLLGRFAGKDRAVAQALSRCFGRDDAWGLQVVGATPIVLLAGLGIDQASAIADALADVEQAGSRLEIQQGVDEGLPKLQWPATPRIRGHLITEFGPGGPKPGAAHTMQLIVPCPYTNQKIQLTLNMTFGRAADGSVIPNVTASTAPYVPNPIQSIPMPSGMPAPIPSPRPTTPAAPRHIIALPTPIPLPGAAPTLNNARLTPSSGAPQQRPAPPVIEGLDALDELSPMDQIPTPPNLMVPASKAPRQSGSVVRPQQPAASSPPPQLPPPQPLPQPIRPPGPPPPPPNNMAKPLTVSFGVKPPAQQAPLPDVPVLHNQKPAPAAPSAPPSPISPMSNNGMPMPSTFNAPMDLSEFEAGVTGSGLVAALQDESQGTADSSLNEDDGTLYSVFIGKTNNPKAHEIVADVLGIAPAEASRMCQKPIVSLAKEVPLAKAQDIKNRFASANIQVRLNKKR